MQSVVPHGISNLLSHTFCPGHIIMHHLSSQLNPDIHVLVTKAWFKGKSVHWVAVLGAPTIRINPVGLISKLMHLTC